MEAIVPTDLHKLAIKLARILGISKGATNGAILSWRLQMIAFTSLVFSKAIQHAIGLIRWEPLLGRDLYAHALCHLAWYWWDRLKLKRKGGAYFLGTIIANANMGDISQGDYSHFRWSQRLCKGFALKNRAQGCILVAILLNHLTILLRNSSHSCECLNIYLSSSYWLKGMSLWLDRFENIVIFVKCLSTKYLSWLSHFKAIANVCHVHAL